VQGDGSTILVQGGEKKALTGGGTVSKQTLTTEAEKGKNPGGWDSRDENVGVKVSTGKVSKNRKRGGEQEQRRRDF